MPAPLKATPEAVHAAITTLEGRGERVTLLSIREEIGGGSLGTIQPILKLWRTEQDDLSRTQAVLDAKTGDQSLNVPFRVVQALDAGRAGLDAVAGAVTEAINTAVSEERRRGRLELDAEREQFERRLSQAQDLARAADEESSQVASDAAQIENERDGLTMALASARTETERLSGELIQEREAHQQVRAEAAAQAAEIQALRQTVARPAPGRRRPSGSRRPPRRGRRRPRPRRPKPNRPTSQRTQSAGRLSPRGERSRQNGIRRARTLPRRRRGAANSASGSRWSVPTSRHGSRRSPGSVMTPTSGLAKLKRRPRSSGARLPPSESPRWESEGFAGPPRPSQPAAVGQYYEKARPPGIGTRSSAPGR